MTVYYPCFVNDQQTLGGVKVLYRHVDILNQAGIPAAVVHARPGFRCTWFANQTVVVHPPVQLLPGDVLALPEAMAAGMGAIAPGVAKVVINQNAFHTWDGVDPAQTHPYLSTPDLLGVTCISEQNRQLLTFAFPPMDVTRIRYSLDPAVFRAGPAERPRRLAYMPRKRAAESAQVLGILRARGSLAEWDVLPVSGLEQHQVAAALRTCALFLSFSQHEGCPLPPLEALASGCHVVGYTGLGGAEFFDPRFATAVPEGDIQAFAEAVETWLDQWPTTTSVAATAGGSAFALGLFSPAAEASSVLQFYGPVLAEATRRGGSSRVLTAADTLLPGSAAGHNVVRRVRRAARILASGV